MALTLLRRKALLEAIVPSDGVAEIQYVDHIEDEGEAFFEAIRAMSLEGMVAKDAASPYRPDDCTPRTRRKEWVKSSTTSATAGKATPWNGRGNNPPGTLRYPWPPSTT